MDLKTKIILALRIKVLILLIILLIVFNTTAKTDCEACSFKINDKEYDAEGFFNLYHAKCLQKKNNLGVFIDFGNLTLENETSK